MARLGIIATVLLVAGSSYATTIHVPADQPTIQAGIDAASNEDTVLVAPGTYTGDGNHDIDLRGKALLVISENGPDYTIIDCGARHYPDWHGFLFRSGEDDNCVVDGFTVTNDHLDYMALYNGGGVTVEDAAPAIRNCVFEYGGRQHTVCDNASPSFSNCIFRFNRSGLGIARNAGLGPASMSAGLLFNPSLLIQNQSSPSFLNCQFYENWADCGNGAAVVCETSSPTFTHCVFTGNYANPSEGGDGGALYLENSQATFDSCVFDSNTSWRGGAIYACTGSTVTLSRCTLSANECYDGGAIQCEGSNLILNACVLDGNLSGWFLRGNGGGIVLGGGTGEITQSTFVNNHARNPDSISSYGFGAAIYSSEAQLVVTNSAFVGNQGVDLIHCVGTATAAISCSDIFGNIAQEWVGCLVDQQDENGNLSVDPLFCDQENGDYSLQTCSPCVARNNDCGVLIGALPAGCGSYCGPVWHVAMDGNDETGDGSEGIPFATIQKGIDAAFNGDTVLVADGTYTGDGNHDIDLRGKAILVKSENGPDYTMVDCGSDHHPPWHGFLFRSGEDTNCVVDGVTVTNDNVSGVSLFNGGGVIIESAAPRIINCVFEYGGRSHTVCDDASPVFVNCTFQYNASGWGPFKSSLASLLSFPSLFIKNNSSPSFSGCVFRNNWADEGDGGAIVCESSNPTFTHCLFNDNSAGQRVGGALFLEGSQASFDSCMFEDNKSEGGGAIYAGAGSTVTLSGCTLRGNEANNGAGGAISGIGTFVDCVFADNRAGTDYGLGGAVSGGGSFVNCIFADNTAGGYYGWGEGGAIHGGGTFAGCTFIGNGAAIGGTIYSTNPATILDRCIVYGSFYNDPDSVFEHTPWIDGCATLTCSDVWGNEGGDWIGCIADQYGQNGNISLDPLFCDTANGNYSLYNFSPCAAANNSCGELIGAFDVGCSLATTLALPDETDSLHVRSHTPHLEWAYEPASVFQQSEYEVEVGTDNDWSLAEMWDPEVVQSVEQQVTYDGAVLVDGATYYVRLRTKLNTVWTPWYETSFRMNSLPIRPTVASPLNGAHVEPFVTLYVNNTTDAESDPLQYQFEVYRQPEMVDLVEQSELIAEQADSTGWTVSEYLEENQLYYWRCRAWDGYEYSDWSQGRFFCLDAFPEAPPAPALIAPVEENLIVYDMLPTFSWTEVDDPDPLDEVHYQLELAIDKNFTWIASYEDLTQPSYETVDSLLFGTHYWWRVKAFDLDGLFSVSDTADFWSWTLGDVTHDHDCSLGDIMILVDHLFINGTPIVPPQVGDVTGDCDITLGDIMRMVDNLFISGTELLVGCE